VKALQTAEITKAYRGRKVVDNVSIKVQQGEVVGLLGPNGAGKTTSFYCIVGLISPDSGKVLLGNEDITSEPMYKRARKGISYLPQEASVFRKLSVEDNLMAILETRSGMNRRQRKDRQNELLDQFGLTTIRRTKANQVSGGERRRLEIARSLITEPKLIMLDEPFAGIDPKTVAEIQDQIRNLVDTYNIGILLTDHQFRETVQVSDRIYVIREGRVFAYGNREQIINNPEVRRHYIGERYDVGHLSEAKHHHSLGEGKGDDAVEASGAHSTPVEQSIANNPEAAPGALGESGGAKPDPLEWFYGSSVTMMGDVVIEQVDLDHAPTPRPDKTHPPKPGEP
jgi:lipopolysaccharide export system ATP-binding protein